MIGLSFELCHQEGHKGPIRQRVNRWLLHSHHSGAQSWLATGFSNGTLQKYTHLGLTPIILIPWTWSGAQSQYFLKLQSIF